MGRQHKHPDPLVKLLLQDLERDGVNPGVIEQFARRAVERRDARDGPAARMPRLCPATPAFDLEAPGSI